MIADRESTPETPVTATDLTDTWPILTPADRLEGFQLLDREEAEDLFLSLADHDQLQLLQEFSLVERRSWLRLLEPDDAADVIQEAPEEEREGLIALLDEAARKEVRALLAYAEDDAGGLMSPRYARLRPDMTVDEAISYLRRQARQRLETIYYVYVLDDHQRLLGVVSFRELFVAASGARVREVMETDVVVAHEELDQEALGHLFARHDLMAIPVVDGEGRLKGIVTVDDIVDVVQEEATEDAQKFGGMSALDAPYLSIKLPEILRKRVGWLTVLLVAQSMTVTALHYFEDQLARAVVLALFVPLIISSGGNSGSQASTLVVRAMALGEVRLRDWWRVFLRELTSGISLGAILGTIGLVGTLIFWPGIESVALVALTIGLSLVGVVLWGTLVGSMLPFILRRLGFDPASASAPLVATLSDVTGLVIYFSVASLVLSGTLL